MWNRKAVPARPAPGCRRPSSSSACRARSPGRAGRIGRHRYRRMAVAGRPHSDDRRRRSRGQQHRRRPWPASMKRPSNRPRDRASHRGGRHRPAERREVLTQRDEEGDLPDEDVAGRHPAVGDEQRHPRPRGVNRRRGLPARSARSALETGVGADSTSATAVAPSDASGPIVTRAQPVSSGATMPTRAAIASRAPIWWPRCSGSPRAAK